MRQDYSVSATHYTDDGWTLRADDPRLRSAADAAVLVHAGSLLVAADAIRAAISVLLDVPQDAFDIHVVVTENNVERPPRYELIARPMMGRKVA